jgi:predicted dehydrogenase
MKTINWGIIGCGAVCELKSGPAFQLVEGSALVAVMRRDASLAKDYATRHQVPVWYNDAAQLVNDPDVNAVYIATPPGTHAYYTRMAAMAGKPVYVEKPMARTYAECLEMVDSCEKQGVPLFVAYYRRQLPIFQQVKTLLVQGCIGQVRSVHISLTQPAYPQDTQPDRSNWRTDPTESGGGYFHDLASHQLDLIDFLLGPIETARGFGANLGQLYTPDDTITAIFKGREGWIGTGTWCFTTGTTARHDEITLVGSAGKISFPCFAFQHPLVCFQDEKPVQTWYFPTPKHIQQPLIQTIVDELLGRGNCPSTGHSAMRTSQIMDLITGQTI